jgi:hypothetical protein
VNDVEEVQDVCNLVHEVQDDFGVVQVVVEGVGDVVEAMRDHGHSFTPGHKYMSSPKSPFIENNLSPVCR